MNRDLLRFHVGEAAEELHRILADLNDPEFEEGALLVSLAHAYHHLNTGWNSRTCPEYDSDESHFEEFRQFPAVFVDELGREAP